MNHYFRRFGLFFLAILSLMTMTLGAFPTKVFAAGETYTWKDNNTIIVSGGDFKSGNYELKLIANSNPQRFTDTTGNQPIHKSGCSLALSVTLTSDAAAVAHAPLPVAPTAPSVGQPGKHYCNEWDSQNNRPSFPGVAAGYDNHTVSIGGTRGNNQSETELDKSVLVVINAPNVASASPPGINITVKDASGNVVKTINAPQEAALGNTDPDDSNYIPPESRPIDYNADFTLEPGKYTVCADIVIKDCKAFTKVKFKSLILTYGETSIERSIIIKVEVGYAGGPQNMTVGPLEVTVRKPDQSIASINTNSVVHKMSDAEEQANGLITVNYTFNVEANYKDADPGSYEVCLVGLTECQEVVKQAGSNATVNFKIDWNSFNANANKDTQCKDKYEVMGVKAATYLICSVIGTATFAIGALDGVIASLLTVDVNDIFDDSKAGNPYHIAWNSFRLLALSLIVIAALVMVVTSAMGLELLDAYTIRKVLPRLLFAAIFIALSWDILEFFTQLSNDAGNGIREIIYAPFKEMADSGGDIGGGSIFVLTLVGTGGALAFGWLGLLSFVVTGLLASLVAVSVLILRKVVILLLIMSAPFAIASYVLPNTRKAWDIWKNSLQAVLVVFPIIMAFIAIGRVFSVTSFHAPGNQTINQLIAVIAYFAPYFLITVAFRMAGGVIAAVGGAMNNGTKGAFDKVKNFRGNKLNQNLKGMKEGRRFADSNPFSRTFNTATLGAGTGWQGRFGLGGRGAEARDQTIRTGAGEIAESMAFKNLGDDSLALEAATYGSGSAAMAGLMARGHSEADSRRAVQAIQSSINFGRSQQFAAAQQMVSNGRAYDDVEHMVETLARASGNNASSAASLAGFANFEAKKNGRNDLAPGFGTLFDAVQREAGINGQGFASQAARQAYFQGDGGVEEKAWLSGDPMRLIGNKPPAFKKMMGHWEDQYASAHADYQTAQAAGNTADAQAAIGRAQKAERAFYEMEQTKPYSGGENLDALNEAATRVSAHRAWLADPAQSGAPPNTGQVPVHRRGDDRRPDTTSPTGVEDPNKFYQELTAPSYSSLARSTARIVRPRDINLE